MQCCAKSIICREAERALSTRRSCRAARALCRGLAVALLVLLACTVAGRSQSTSGSNGGSSGSGQGSIGLPRSGFGHQGMGPLSNDDDFDLVMVERRIRALNAERQKQMVTDANKLLKLAKELNDEVAAANTSSFTPDQLHKIAEIEKLARSVRERMTSEVGVAESPSLMSPPTPVYPTH
jgi:hypothetical protein